jgi:hypothetical protein
MPDTAVLIPHALSKLARHMAATSRADAEGYCLGLTLDFASRAQQDLQMDLHLVHWHLKGDPHYRDHWAIWLDEDRIIDLTRAQVDGSRRWACSPRDYPAHYAQARTYPASVLMRGLPHDLFAKGTRLPDAALRTLWNNMLRFDLGMSWRAGSISGLLAAVQEHFAFQVWLTQRRWGEALQARSRLLQLRLRSVPEYANRQGPAAPPHAKARHSGAPTPAPKAAQPASRWHKHG